VKTVTAEQAEEVAIEVLAPVGSTDIVSFAETLVLNLGKVPLQTCFAAAADVGAYLTAVRNKTVVQASRYLPATIEAVGSKAAAGDLDAAKLLFDYLGLRVKTPLAQVNTQVNVTVPTLKDIIDIGGVASDGEVET